MVWLMNGVVLGTLAVSVIAFLIAAVERRRRRNAPSSIAPRFEVPAELPPLIAAELLGDRAEPLRGQPAQVLHLAVGGLLLIEQESGDEDQDPDEVEVRLALRRTGRKPAGDTLDAKTLNALFYGRRRDKVLLVRGGNPGLQHRMIELTWGMMDGRAYFEDRFSRGGRLLGTAGLFLLAPLVAVTVTAFAMGAPGLALVSILVGIASFIMASIARWTDRGLSQRGAESLNLLLGVREFIQASEADRLQILRSNPGTKRTPNGEADVARIYEMLLPYAVLFGLEAEWAEVLQLRYQEAGDNPEWFPAMVQCGTPGPLLQMFCSAVNAAIDSSGNSRSSGNPYGLAGDIIDSL